MKHVRPNSEVYLMDCMKGMKQYPDKWFDLAVVDPPYGIRVTNMAYIKERKATVKQKNGTRLNPYSNKQIKNHSNWDDSAPTVTYYNELVRVSKAQIIFGINYFDWGVIGDGRIVWDKCVPEGVSFKGTETAHCSLINHTETVKLLWSGFSQAKSLTESTVQQGNKKLNEKRIHPCHKPILLYSWIFKNYAKEGMKILDTHLGSQSSRIAANHYNLIFTGFETDEDYFNEGNKRYDEAISQNGKLFSQNGKVISQIELF